MLNLKKEIRRQIIELRNSLSKNDVEGKSSLIAKQLKSLKQFGTSKHIMCYMDFRNEVMTAKFIKNCLDLGKRVSVPVIVKSGDGNKEMFASEIDSIEEGFELSSFGILEPVKDLQKAVEPGGLDFVVVPGLAFDREKYRLGYGAGFYDRFLPRLGSNCLKVGIAFDLQIVDKVPTEEHDFALDLIITESQIF